MSKYIPSEILKKIATAQKNEITEYHIYKILAKKIKEKHNKDILNKIADEEKKHYDFWQNYTKKEFKFNKIKVLLYPLFAKIFGLVFAVKLMEKDEVRAQEGYEKIEKYIPETKKIIEEELKHEMLIIDLLEEKHLEYMGSVVLGLNDALIELTGVLAGATLTINNGKLIAVIGFITGIAASLSMSASEYLSIKTDKKKLSPLKSASYTGITYLITVLFLILPFFILAKPVFALVITLIVAIFIIAFFNFYISIAKNTSFWKRFLEMSIITIIVSIITFFIGWTIKHYFNLDI